MAKIRLTPGDDVLVVNGQYDKSAEIFAGDGDDKITLFSPTSGVDGGRGNDVLESQIHSGIPPDYAVELLYYNSPGDVEVDLKNGFAIDGWGSKDSIKGFYSVHIGSLNNQALIYGSAISEYLYIGGGPRSAESPKQYIYFRGEGGGDLVRLGNTELNSLRSLSDLLIYHEGGPNRIVLETSSQVIAIETTGSNREVNIQLGVRGGAPREEFTLNQIRELASQYWGASAGNDSFSVDESFPRAVIQGGFGDDQITLKGLTKGIMSEPGNDSYTNESKEVGVTLYYLQHQIGNTSLTPPNDHLYINLFSGIAHDEWGDKDTVKGFNSVHIGDSPSASIIGNSENNSIYIGGSRGARFVDVFGGEGVDTVTIANGGISDWIKAKNDVEVRGYNQHPDGSYDYLEIAYGAQSVFVGQDVEYIRFQSNAANQDSKRYTFDDLSKIATASVNISGQ